MNKFFLTALSCALAVTPTAQQGRVLTDKDYEHSESFLSYNTQSLVDHEGVRPNWLPGDKFWYRVLTPTGSEFMLVNPAEKSRVAAFDQQKLASALSAATGQSYTASMLPFQTIAV